MPRRWDAALLGEAPSRIIIAIEPAQLDAVMRAAAAEQSAALLLGQTGGDRLRFDGFFDLPLAQLADAWHNGLRSFFG